jgi:hypothetical protein
MKIGIFNDGKFGARTFEFIRRRCPTEWIMSQREEVIIT